MAVIIGSFPKGPLYTPKQIQSLRECELTFGGLNKNNLSSLVVSQFLNNGGKDLWNISTGTTLSDKAVSMLKGLSRVSKILSVIILLLLETFLLHNRETQKIFTAAISLLPTSIRPCICWILPNWVALNKCKRRNDMGAIKTEYSASKCGDLLPLIQVRSASTSSQRLNIPASGTMTGVYARIDHARGVWKVPAGTEANLQGVAGLEPLLTSKEINLLASVNINP